MKARFVLVAGAVCALTTMAAGQTPVYVDPTSPNPGAMGGMFFWDNAFHSIEDALNSSTQPVLVRIAEGTYAPNASGTGAVTLFEGDPTFLIDGDQLEGGYIGYNGGSSGSLTEPDGSFRATLLKGVGRNHIVVAAQAASSLEARVDGFTIIDGHADDASVTNGQNGAGLLILGKETEVEEVLFSLNAADGMGGGAHVEGLPKQVTFANCEFAENQAAQGAGFSALECPAGAGSAPRVVLGNVVFHDNGTTGSSSLPNSMQGGAIFLGERVSFYGYNLAAWDNVAREGGAVFADLTFGQDVAEHLWVNCTFAHNRLTSTGLNTAGGIHYESRLTPPLGNAFYTASIENSIVTNNGGGAIWVHPNLRSTAGMGAIDRVSYRFSDTLGALTGVADGGGNIHQDPRFVSPAGRNLRLRFDSPCIDSGSNVLIQPGLGRGDLADVNDDLNPSEEIPLDQDRTPRVKGFQTVDMGAYELGFQVIPPL